MHHSRSAITFHDSKRIDDDRGLCETPGCQIRQETSNIRLCRDCVAKKNRYKRDKDEESEAKDCAGCGKKVPLYVKVIASHATISNIGRQDM